MLGDETYNVRDYFPFCANGFFSITKRIWIWYRAGGGVICEICGRELYDHPPERDPEFSTKECHWWSHHFKIACNGDRVKL